MKSLQLTIRSVGILLATLPGVHAAPVFSTAGGAGSTGDPFDLSQGARVIASSRVIGIAGENIREAFGGTGGVEDGNVIFGDGFPLGSVSAIDWQTAGWVNLTGVELRFSQDGASANRGTAAYNLLASQDGTHFVSVSSGNVPLTGAAGSPMLHVPLLISDTELAAGAENARAFRVEITRNSTAGPRLIEIDGMGTPGSQTTPYLDPFAFNAVTNSEFTGQAGSDQSPGLATDIIASSRVLGTDTAEDAFGNNNGEVEPETFIFGDGGGADNGDSIVGNGSETVHSITWRTTQPLTLAGFQVILSGDGGSSLRDTEMVQFLVGGLVVDRFDNNGFDGTVLREFVDGTVTGDDFRIEFTATTTAGNRIFSIDALTAPSETFSGEVVINEVCSANASSLEDEDQDAPDWIELYNNDSAPMDISGWGLSDAEGDPMKWTFPAGTVIPGRHFLLVFLSDKDRAVGGQPLHTNFKLKSEGEAVFLTRPNLSTADSAAAVRLEDDLTFGRFPNGTGAWKFFTVASPGLTNSLSTPWDSLVFEKPAFSLRGGFVPSPQAVSLSTTEADVTIRYTLDGSAPQLDSPEFTAPFDIASKAGQPNVLSLIMGTSTANQHTDGWKPPVGEVRKATVVRARAFRTGAPPGPVGTQTYFAGDDGPRPDGLPVLSIASTPSGLFDYNEGIYMLGKIFDDYVAAHPGEPLTGHTPANYTQRGNAWEREAHLEWFEPWPTGGSPGPLAGTRAWGEPIALDIKGQSSRSFRQKSFGIKARGTAGKDNSIGYPIFPGRVKLGNGNPLEDFRHLRLRNFGNDWDYAMMRDSFAHRLVQNLGLAGMASRPASIYLDGEYWGILEVRENQDPRYLQSHYGIDNSEVIIVNGYGGLDEGLPGDEQSYLDLNAFCQANSLASQANYEHVAGLVDVESCRDYHLAEIFFANADWPQNNIRVWRRRLPAPDPSMSRGKDGLWRWLLFDVDLGLGHPWSAGVTENTLAVALAPNGRPAVPQTAGTAIFRGLMTNPAFRDDFIRRAADLLNSTFSPGHAVALVDLMESEMLPGMDEHTRRWQPAFGSVAGWQSRVDDVRTFARDRATHVRNHLASRFGLTPALLTVDAAGGGTRGTVRIGGLEVGTTLPGANPAAPFPWSGTYFQNLPVTLSALPAPGWRFLGWTGTTETTETVSLSLTGDTAVTALFIAAPATPLSAAYRPADSACDLRFQGTPLATYQLQVSTDLKTWDDAITFTPAADGIAAFTVPSAPGRSFFRSVPLAD